MDILRKITNAKNGNVVFTGSVAERMNGINVEFNDVDFIVLDLDGLESFGKLETFTTKSVFSESGKRAFVKRLGGFDFDIFVEEKLPEFIEYEGVKYETLESMIKWTEKTISKTTDHRIKEILVLRLKTLKNE
mgnify:CR=1 FL=1